MKKSLFILSFLSLLTFTVSNAQIYNHSFENWALDTFYLAPGQISNLPADTIEYYDPVQWSSSNVLTGLDSLGGVSLVTQSSNAYHGNSAIQLVTDTISLPVIPNFPALAITIPGFALNGDFPITTESLIGGGAVISPISIKGAGQPNTQRLSKISGYYNYTPVFNPNTNSNDTCIIWATLRRGDVAVADAIFRSTSATSGYLPFEADFVYSSCLDPDTLVVFLASSVPNIAQILNATSGLVRGSVLLVDSIYYNDLPNNFNFPPVARNDIDTTTKNVPKNLFVKDNDEDCNDTNASLTLSINTGPFNGTAIVAGNAISYTPATDFVGIDTIIYTITDAGGLSASALVRILVLNSTGISQASLIPVSVFPVPASNELNVQFENKGKSNLMVYDMLGSLLLNVPVNSNNSNISVAALPAGVYALHIVNDKSAVIAKTKFTVSK